MGPIELGQYVSLAFGRAARDAGIAVSMGSRGDAYDNAVAETFFATLKKGLVNRRSWPSRLELQSAVFEYIEAFYNRQRRHSTLGMLSPSPTNNYDSPRSVVENNRSNNNNQQQHRKDQGVTQTGAGPLADYCFDRRVSTEAASTNVREAASLGAKRTSRGDETPTLAGATAIGRGHRLEPRGILGISGPSSSARSHRHAIVRSSPRLRLLRALSLATAA